MEYILYAIFRFKFALRTRFLDIFSAIELLRFLLLYITGGQPSLQVKSNRKGAIQHIRDGTPLQEVFGTHRSGLEAAAACDMFYSRECAVLGW